MANNPLPLALLAATTAFAANAQEGERPNILYIMCDDMGYGDLGCYGQQLISTPNIDRLAAQGMRFTQAYAGSPVSAPSRACFMTGQHSGHTYVRGNRERSGGRVMYGQNAEYAVTGQEPYDTAHVVLPEIFKAAGYATGMFGKWAGGYEGSVSTPDKRGVDEYFGYLCQFQAHSYFPNFLNEYSRQRGDTAVRRVVMEENVKHPMWGEGYRLRTQYSADIIHRHALRWLRERAGQKEPFLGIFTYTLPHAELSQPRDSLLEAYSGRFCTEKTFRGSRGSRYYPTDEGHAQFAAMIARLDKQVGEIMQALEETGQAGNTVVIFTSDNGPHEEGGADPDYFNRDGLLRGHKRSTYEGGIRVPFIVRWPGRVEAGTDNDHQLAFYDLLPTFCDIAGISGYPDRFRNPRLGKADRFDGISFLPTLTGQAGQREHECLYWEFAETDMIGVRRGDWKLVVKRGECRLYDLATDLHEDHDLAARHPEIVEQLKEAALREHTPSSLFPVTLPGSTERENHAAESQK